MVFEQIEVYTTAWMKLEDFWLYFYKYTVIV